MKIGQTKGIVLNQFKYSETSLIINVLTNSSGIMSFIINGVRKKKSKIPANNFQAFNILDINYLESNKSDLHKITEVSKVFVLNDIIFNISKSSICMFLAEIVHNTNRVADKQEVLYQFLEQLIQFIDGAKSQEMSNIHLWTLNRLMQFSGISPENNYSESKTYFNPVEGSFTNNKHSNTYVYNTRYSRLFFELQSSKIDNNWKIKMSRLERTKLLKLMLQYFQLHLEGFKSSKSLEILSELFE